MKKEEFIDRVKTGRGEWTELLSMVDADAMLKPGQEGEWSAKDILAHVMWYERADVGIAGDSRSHRVGSLGVAAGRAERGYPR